MVRDWTVCIAVGSTDTASVYKFLHDANSSKIVDYATLGFAADSTILCSDCLNKDDVLPRAVGEQRFAVLKKDIGIRSFEVDLWHRV